MTTAYLKAARDLARQFKIMQQYVQARRDCGETTFEAHVDELWGPADIAALQAFEEAELALSGAQRLPMDV